MRTFGRPEPRDRMLRGLSSSRSGRFAAAAANMRDQERQRGRRDAIDAGRMADRARLLRDELLLHLVGKARQRRIIEIIWQGKTLVPAIGRDVGRLTGEIDLVFGVALALVGGFGRPF